MWLIRFFLVIVHSSAISNGSSYHDKGEQQDDFSHFLEICDSLFSYSTNWEMLAKFNEFSRLNVK